MGILGLTPGRRIVYPFALVWICLCVYMINIQTRRQNSVEDEVSTVWKPLVESVLTNSANSALDQFAESTSIDDGNCGQLLDKDLYSAQYACLLVEEEGVGNPPGQIRRFPPERPPERLNYSLFTGVSGLLIKERHQPVPLKLLAQSGQPPRTLIVIRQFGVKAWVSSIVNGVERYDAQIDWYVTFINLQSRRISRTIHIPDIRDGSALGYRYRGKELNRILCIMNRNGSPTNGGTVRR
jgi:hypothetical protein